LVPRENGPDSRSYRRAVDAAGRVNQTADHIHLRLISCCRAIGIVEYVVDIKLSQTRVLPPCAIIQVKTNIFKRFSVAKFDFIPTREFNLDGRFEHGSVGIKFDKGNLFVGSIAKNCLNRLEWAVEKITEVVRVLGEQGLERAPLQWEWNNIRLGLIIRHCSSPVLSHTFNFSVDT